MRAQEHLAGHTSENIILCSDQGGTTKAEAEEETRQMTGEEQGEGGGVGGEQQAAGRCDCTCITLCADARSTLLSPVIQVIQPDMKETCPIKDL